MKKETLFYRELHINGEVFHAKNSITKRGFDYFTDFPELKFLRNIVAFTCNERPNYPLRLEPLLLHETIVV